MRLMITAVVSVLTLALTGCADRNLNNRDLPVGTWCDADGDTILEFKGSKMYVKWWEGQEGTDKYSIALKTNDFCL